MICKRHHNLIFQAIKISRKDYIIEISKKYSVTSKFTSFVAIEKREEGETFDSTTAPDIEEILDREDVDILGYIGFEEDDEESEEKSEEESEEYVYEVGYLIIPNGGKKPPLVVK